MKGYRTIAVNLLSTIVPIMALTEWRDVLPKDWVPYYALGLAVANVWLRSITTTPVGRSE